MSDLDITAIRTEVAAALQAAVGDVNVYAVIQTGPQLPAFHVGPATSINHHPTYGAGPTVRLKLLLETDRANNTTAQRRIDEWLAKPGPIIDLEKHTTDVWESLTVIAENTDPRPVQIDGEPSTLVVELALEITT